MYKIHFFSNLSLSFSNSDYTLLYKKFFHIIYYKYIIQEFLIYIYIFFYIKKFI